MRIQTPERAERLARLFQLPGWRVVRLPDPPVIHTRMLGTLQLECSVYAEIWKGDDLRMRVLAERISHRSMIL